MHNLTLPVRFYPGQQLWGVLGLGVHGMRNMQAIWEKTTQKGDVFTRPKKQLSFKQFTSSLKMDTRFSKFVGSVEPAQQGKGDCCRCLLPRLMT